MVLHTVLSAKRDKLFLSILLGIICVICVSVFFGSFAIVEQKQTIISYIAFLTRVVFIFGMMIFAVFHIKEMFSTKEFDFLMALSKNRSQFVLNLYFGLALMATIIPLILFAILSAISGNVISSLIWSFTLYIEALLMLSFSLFFALSIRTPVGCLMILFATYLICRMVGEVAPYINLTDRLHEIHIFQSFTEFCFKSISFTIPRVDLMARTEWLIYPEKNLYNAFVGLIQGAIFTTLMVSLSLVNIKKKQF